MNKTAFVPIALIGLVALVLSACGGGEAGLTRAEVEEIVRAEVADAQPQDAGTSPGMDPATVEGIVKDAIAEMPQPEPGLTRAEVEEIVNAGIAVVSPGAEADVEGIVDRAIAAMPPPEPGLSRGEVEEIVQAALPEPEPGLTAEEAEEIVRTVIASIPSKASPADYTRHVVDNAITKYRAQGLDATLAHYNSPQSVDGQWYVFIIDENDVVIGHPDPERLGLDLKGWVGTDANGYNFGPEMLSATEDGKWVSYVYRNPESGVPVPVRVNSRTPG